MSHAVTETTHLLERTLGKSPAYKKIEDRLYVIKQGSSYVTLTVLPWGQDRALIRFLAQLVRGVHMDETLAVELLRLNALLRFGSFGYIPEENVVVFTHTILGGDTLDAEELTSALRDVALIADEYDNKIIDSFGGQTMQEFLEETALVELIQHQQKTHLPEVGKKHNKKKSS
jgi:hypothetical protein